MARPQVTKREAIAAGLQDHLSDVDYEREVARQEDEQDAEHYEGWLDFVCYDNNHEECTNQQYHNHLRENEEIDRMLILDGINPENHTRLTYHQHMLVLSQLDPPLSTAEWRGAHAKWDMEADSVDQGQLTYSDMIEDTRTYNEHTSLMTHITTM